MSDNETPQESQDSAEAQAEGKEQAQAGFAMDRVYLKDVSFESPNSPEVFTKEWKPEFKMDLNTKNKAVQEGIYEVSVCVTLTASVEGMTAYIAEVEQGGIFQVLGLQGIQLAQVLNSACPSVLFPYLREAMDNIIVKGSFAPAHLAPVNFDAIFANAVRQKQAEMEAAKAEAEKESADSTTH